MLRDTEKMYFDDEKFRTLQELNNIVGENPKMILDVLAPIADDQSLICWDTQEYASGNVQWLSSYFATPEQKEQYFQDGCKFCVQSVEYYNSLEETSPLKKKLLQTYPNLFTAIR